MDGGRGGLTRQWSWWNPSIKPTRPFPSGVCSYRSTSDWLPLNISVVAFSTGTAIPGTTHSDDHAASSCGVGGPRYGDAAWKELGKVRSSKESEDDKGAGRVGIWVSV